MADPRNSDPYPNSTGPPPKEATQWTDAYGRVHTNPVYVTEPGQPLPAGVGGVTYSYIGPDGKRYTIDQTEMYGNVAGVNYRPGAGLLGRGGGGYLPPASSNWWESAGSSYEQMAQGTFGVDFPRADRPNLPPGMDPGTVGGVMPYGGGGYQGAQYQPGGGPTPQPTPGSGTPGSGTQAQNDAYGILNDTLGRYGLSGLASWAWSKIVNGESADQILIDLRGTDVYKARFPGMAQRQANGYGAMSEAEYVAYEDQVRQVMRAYGMPAGFWDQPADIAHLLGANISAAEVAQRVRDGYGAIATAPPEIRNEFASYFGAQGDAALAAYMLDDKRALDVLEKQLTEAQVGGTLGRFGFDIAEPRAAQLVGAGVTQAGAQTGGMKLAEIAPLFQTSVSEQPGLTAADQGISAVFGLDATSQAELERRMAERQAAFAGGGGADISAGGLTGLGRAL